MLFVTINRQEIKEFFEGIFTDWRAKQTTRKATIGQFADFLDITRESLNSYMLKGSVPEGDNLVKIGLKYPAVYALVGKVPPNPRINLLNTLASGMSEEGQEELLRSAQEIREREQKDAGNESPSGAT